MTTGSKPLLAASLGSRIFRLEYLGDLRSLVITLLASIDATTRDATVEERTGALFLALTQLASLSEADRFEHAVIGSAYVLQLAGYPTIRRLDGVQRQNLRSLWDDCSRGVETEPEDIGDAIWTTFYRQTELTTGSFGIKA